MFESDDFDQVLSQFEFPDEATILKSPENRKIEDKHEPDKLTKNIVSVQILPRTGAQSINDNVATEMHDRIRNNRSINNANQVNEITVGKDIVSLKHTKRKMIHSYFDPKSKRKFPGPAGLLTGGFEENKDENICQIELLSQDVDFTQNNLRGDLFESPLWSRLLEDLKSWNLHEIDSIKTIKQQAMTGTLKKRKAHTITAFVETVDRSATDPLIIMRDTTGKIKGTLHRDAWSTFSKYIASEYCACILWKPTILTTGSAFKKHYLNITLSNILAIYSSTVLTDDADTRLLPDGYAIVYADDYTVIKTRNNLNNIGTNDPITNGFDNNASDLLDGLDNNASDLLDGLDNIFSDEIF